MFLVYRQTQSVLKPRRHRGAEEYEANWENAYFQTPLANSGAVRRTLRERWTRGAAEGAAEATIAVLTGVRTEAATAVAGALVSVELAGTLGVGLLVAAKAVPDE